MSLSSDIQGMVKDKPETLEIDVSKYMGLKPKTHVFRFIKPNLQKVSKVPSIVDWLKLQFSNNTIEEENRWEKELAHYVAVFMISFDKSCLAEEDQPSWRLTIAHFFQNLDVAFFEEMLELYREAFPKVLPTTEAVDEAKND